jgi:hypothetical protein
MRHFPFNEPFFEETKTHTTNDILKHSNNESIINKFL